MNKKINLITFLYIFLMYKVIFTADNDEQVNQCLICIKKNFSINEYDEHLKNDLFTEKLINKLKDFSLQEIMALKSYFNPQLSNTIIQYIKNLNNEEQGLEYIHLLLNCDSSLLKDNYNQEKTNIDYYIPLLMKYIKRLQIGDGVFHFSDAINSGIEKYVKESTMDERKECAHLIMILEGSIDLTRALYEELIDGIYNERLDFSIENTYIEICVDKFQAMKKETISIDTLCSILLLILNNINIEDNRHYSWSIYCKLLNLIKKDILNKLMNNQNEWNIRNFFVQVDFFRQYTFLIDIIFVQEKSFKNDNIMNDLGIDKKEFDRVYNGFEGTTINKRQVDKKFKKIFDNKNFDDKNEEALFKYWYDYSQHRGIRNSKEYFSLRLIFVGLYLFILLDKLCYGEKNFIKFIPVYITLIILIIEKYIENKYQAKMKSKSINNIKINIKYLMKIKTYYLKNWIIMKD